MDASRLHGIHPVLYAFFDAQARPLRAPLVAQVEAAVRHGAHGIVVLGHATEVHKLDTAERRRIMEWTAEALAGRLPLAVTVAEPSVHGQAALVRAAKDVGADWVILQPPPVAGMGEGELLRFFGAVAATTALPVAIENAPQCLGTGLSGPSLAALHRQHSNVCLIKGDAPAHVIEALVEDTDGAYRVFNGRGGMELPECLRAGCVGVIPAPECFDVLVAVYEAMRRETPEGDAEAERLYREILPLIVFTTSSTDALLCYGKRVVARRLGIEHVFDRAPCLRPTEFGLLAAERLSAPLPPL